MKKICISMAAISVLAGCSVNEEVPAVDTDSRVPIELSASVNAISRAVINSNDPMSNIGIAGWETKDENADYTTAPTWHAHLSTTASTSEQKVTFDTIRYYNAEENIYTHMKAWHPCGDYKKSPIQDNKVTFTNSGTTDVMMANIIKGNKTHGATTLTFKHMTSQINFKVVAGDGLAANTKIKAITILDTQYPTGFDISKSFTESDAIIYSESKDFSVPNVNSNQTITKNPTAAGDPVMIRPMGANTFKVKVETSSTTYEDCEVKLTGDAIMQAGNAYTITLTFGQAGLELTATVEEWKSGTGSAELQ